MSVKMEAPFEEDTSLSLVPISQSPSADCDSSGARRGGGSATQDQLQPQQREANTSTPILLYPVNADRFYSPTTADGKTFLKLAPATGPPPPEKVTTAEFTYQAIVYLIEAVGRRWSLYGTRERSQLFQSVQKELEAQGHPLPVERIRRKWNNLIVTYKRVKDRGRETGQAKTSWEYFEMMDAMLGDTIGSQVNNTTVPVTTLPMTTVGMEALAQGYKPLLLPNDDIVATYTQTAELNPSPLPPPNPTDTPSPRLTNHTDSLQPRLSPAPGLAPRRGPSHHGGLRLRRQKVRGFSFHPSCSSSSSQGQQLQQQQRLEENTSLLQEVLRRQAELAGPEQGLRGGGEARERRRERREARMARSLGRIATALELLSSKQDTVIALLQRLADKK